MKLLDDIPDLARLSFDTPTKALMMITIALTTSPSIHRQSQNEYHFAIL